MGNFADSHTCESLAFCLTECAYTGIWAAIREGHSVALLSTEHFKEKTQNQYVMAMQ